MQDERFRATTLEIAFADRSAKAFGAGQKLASKALAGGLVFDGLAGKVVVGFPAV
ncbi:hypothetical protein D3C85_1800330 [compost metagenome]